MFRGFFADVSRMISTLICEGNLGMATLRPAVSMRLVDDADEIADLQALEQEPGIPLADAHAAG
jgi:hypothetical protein